MHQGGLLEGDEDRTHAGDIFGLLAGLGVKVTQPGHPFPLSAWDDSSMSFTKASSAALEATTKNADLTQTPHVSYLVMETTASECLT